MNPKLCCCVTIGIFFGIILLILTVILFIQFGVFFPSCPSTNNRICNGRGVCERGFCKCDVRFSGFGCTDTRIPGYDTISNQECSGNGYGWPFSNFPDFCKQTIQNGKLVGPGWFGSECTSHVRRTLQQLAEVSNNRFLVPNASTIPWCQCYPPWGGIKCQIQNCPSDENGLICGSNGNKTVGILTNQTSEENNGCQCTTQVRYDVPPLLEMFNKTQQAQIRGEYYAYFNKILCAQTAVFEGGVFTQQDTNPKNLTVASNDGVYECHCEFGWGGTVCTENQCPRPVENGQICSNFGHPSYGQGLITNTTKQKSKGRDCLINCVEGTELCNSQVCTTTQTPQTPLFAKSRVCTWGAQCIQPNPLRCFDGSCVPIPENARECALNYQTGSIDPTQIETLLTPCIIQTEETLRACFRNTSLVALGYQREGFLWNTSLPLRFSLDSPLAYFQFSTNSTETIVRALWAEQTFYTNQSLVSGSFAYNTTGAWIEDGQVIANQTNTGVTLCGVPTNYSGSITVPSNFSKVKLTDTVGQLTYVLQIESSSLSLFTPVNQTYILVSGTSNLQGAAQEWFFPPSGLIVDRGFCLSEPSLCSFLLWEDQLRNLQSTRYVCHQAGLPVIIPTPCPTPYSTYKSLISNHLWGWETCLTGKSLFSTSPIVEKVLFRLERNYTERNSFENEIQFFPPENIVQVFFPALLTVASVTFPCACSPTNQINNQSTLNQQWWGEKDLRPVSDLVLGDWVLTSTIVRGEQEFLRSKIVGFSPLNNSFSVWNPQLGIYYDSFYADSRRLALDEVLEGSSDKNLILQPLRCPDGQQSSSQVIIQEVPTLCNCTFTTPLVQCGCLDRMLQNWTCTCQMNEQYCQCGAPALPEFEMDLLGKLNTLTQTSCQCIIYDPQVGEQSNTSVTTGGEFNITLSQVPEFLIVKTSGPLCNFSTIFQLIGTNKQLFFNRTVDITLLEGEITNCEHWFTITYPNDIAIDHLSVLSPSSPIEWATLVFSTQGFSLASISPPTFSASSQGDSPPSVVILKNSSFWITNQTTLPLWIEVDYHQAFFLQYITVVFYKAGIVFNGIQIPWRIYLQGWVSEQSGWKTLGSFGVYVEEGGWSERSLFFNTTQQYSRFRLITENGNFGVRQWFMYANQACLCEDGSLLTLQLTSTQGLPSVQSILDEIAAYNQELLGPGCRCENNCLLQIAPNTTLNFANDGICEDAIFVSSLFGITPVAEFIANETFNYTFPYKLFTSEILPGISTVQFADDPSFFLNLTEQVSFFSNGQNSFPNFPPDPNTPNISGLVPNSTILYLNSSTLITLQSQVPRGDPYVIQIYINDTFLLVSQNFTVNYGGVIENNQACCAGCDCNDCGSSIRNKNVQTGVKCEYTLTQSNLISLMSYGNTLVNQSYFVANLSSLQQAWSGFYTDILLERLQPLSVLLNCPSQVCPPSHPIRCLNGACKNFLDECENRFNCPGNGCVQQTDAASFGNVAYRCACQLGWAGDACQFGATLPATPELLAGQLGYTPGAVAAHCGGPPPLRLLPPVVNKNQFLNPDAIIEENFKQTRNSPLQGTQQENYLRVMPNNGWGPVITFPWVIKETPFDVLAEDQQVYQTDCPPARRGYHGEIILLSDDLVGEDPITKAPIWRVYVNPLTGQNETFTWRAPFPIKNGIIYHDFPYRCPNGQCVADPANCTQSVALFPLCNGQGECRADGSCLCRGGRKTGLINQRMSDLVKYPYGVNNDGVPDPTIWELNFNWRYFGLLQCLERDCEEEFCGTPTGCFPGTPALNFVDRWHLCDGTTKNAGKCAPPGTDCSVAKGLKLPLVCSGNGIPKVKDFTGEIFCYCGKPVSPTASITDITQITDLKKAGWGGESCQFYYASDAPLVYSQWDFQRNQPHFDQVTNEVLPGRWIKGIIPVGPKPEQRVLWENCCSGYSRLNLCPNVICDIAGDLQCVPATQCALPNTPQIFNCNGHGVARADGTCECESSQKDGFGFTNDFTQFDINGCYREFQCPISKRNNAPCYFLEACIPGEFRYPAPQDPYLSQQAYMCGPQEGTIQNSTIINQISTSANIFLDRLIQALTIQAIEVQSAIIALGGCICVYPTDTQFSKYGMLPGSNYTFKESYHAASLVFGEFPGYPFLTDQTLETYGNESYLISPGDVLEFHLYTQLKTNISAVRLYGESPPGATFTLRTSSLQTACTDAQPVTQQSGTLQWLSGPITTAFYCGPFFTCATFVTLPDYNFNCGASSLTEACQNWKTQQCFSDPGRYRYWPLDSPAVYEGCKRAPNDCTCCEVQQNTIFTPVEDILRFEYSGTAPMRLGQVQVYGVTEEAIIFPPGLTAYLERLLPQRVGAECQDYQFLLDYLGALESYFFAPPETQLNFTDSFEICNQTGGYLGVPQSLGEAAALPGTSNGLMRQCNLLLTDEKECWVGARDSKYNELFTERSEMILSPCTTCYEPAVLPKGPSLSFSTYPLDPDQTANSPSNYRAPVFPGQISTKTSLEEIIAGVRPPVVTFWTQLYDGGSQITQLGCDFYISYQIDPLEVGILILRYDIPVSPGGVQARLNMVTFKFEFGKNEPQKLVKVRAWASTQLPLIQMDNQGSDCVYPCIELVLRDTSVFTFNLEYGQPPEYLTFCKLFETGINDFESDRFCDTTNNYAPITVIQTLPRGCGIINLFPSINCPAIKQISQRDGSVNGVEVRPPSYSYDGDCNYLYTFGWAHPPFSDGYRTFFINNPNSCGTKEQYEFLTSFKTGCFTMYPFDGIYKVEVSAERAQFSTEGKFSDNFNPGVNEFPFLPTFLSIKIVSARVYNQIDSFRNGELLLPPTQPIYFIRSPRGVAGYKLQASYLPAQISICSQCYLLLEGNFEWKDYIYSQALTWLTGVSTESVTIPPVEIYVQKISPEGQNIFPLKLAPSTSNDGFLPQKTFIHLTTYIQSRNATLHSTRQDTYQWYLSTCLAVTASSYITRVCREKLNFICQFDYLRYAVITGYMCPQCGDNTRISGLPQPGQTCFTSNPLANATAFPTQHEIYENYLRKTLFFYAQTITTPTTLTIPPGNLVWGIPECWQKWANGLGTRGPQSGGSVPRGQLPSLNWYDMCLGCNWGVDCQKEGYSILDPKTNSERRTCAVSTAQCDLSLPVTGNSPLSQRYYPPIFTPVNPQVATSDKTCGDAVILSSYLVMDKWGAPQSTLREKFQILETTSSWVQLQISTLPAFYFNGGKTNIPFNKFSWNYTTTIYGQYQLVSCPGGCTGSSMNISIYPLNIGYEIPQKRLSKNIPLQTGVNLFQVEFSPTPLDTGTILINGELFPEAPFQGVGFDLFLPIGSVIYLYNPTLIDPPSIAQCTTRELPFLVEPLTSINSTVPFNKCIFNEEIQLQSDGKDIGECLCSWSYGGDRCDCIAVTTKYNERTCGGFGSELTTQQGFDGQFYSTGEGENGGCFILSNGESQCVTKDVGQCIFALLVDGAIWNFPAVYVDTVPANGQSIFINVAEGGEGLEEGIQVCQTTGNQLSYWYTSSELTQFINTATPPALIAANFSSIPTQWPWVNAQEGTFFINGQTISQTVTLGNYDCISDPGTCKAINFNNLAYNLSSCLTDGTIVTACAGGVVFYDGPLQVFVVVFSLTPSGVTITCDGPGPCGGELLSTETKQSICRCPSRAIQITGGNPTEVQIFIDTFRTNLYPYN